MSTDHSSYVRLPARKPTRQEEDWIREIVSSNSHWADTDLGDLRIVGECTCGCRSVVLEDPAQPQNPRFLGHQGAEACATKKGKLFSPGVFILPPFAGPKVVWELVQPRRAASASSARSFSKAKNAGDWPMKRPISVRNLTTPLAMSLVSVGRITEHRGRLGLMKGQGSGMIRFGLKSSVLKRAALCTSKTTLDLLMGSKKLASGALPALSCQV